MKSDWEEADTASAAFIRNKPVIPQNMSDLENDMGYVTSEELPEFPSVPENVSELNNDAGYITANDLPEFPSVPENVSELNNDAGYITANDLPEVPAQVKSDWEEADTASAAFIRNKPVIPQNMSDLENDMGFITAEDLPEIPDVSNLQGQIDDLQEAIEALGNANFHCGTSTVNDYDGNTYNTIKIGSQCWMKQNLKTKHFNDGTAITFRTTAANSPHNPYYYAPGRDTNNVPTYGYLYNWYAATNGPVSGQGFIQGICPAGWQKSIRLKKFLQISEIPKVYSKVFQLFLLI